jgi:hypothetical protein
MHTLQTQAYRDAIHLSKLIPLGKKTEAKKQAVHRLMTQIKVMLAKVE